MARQSVSDVTADAHQLDFGNILVWAVQFGILLILFTPLIISDSTIFPFIVGKAIYARTVIEITAVVWVALILLFPRYRPRGSVVLLALVVWVAISVLAGVMGVSFTRSLWSSYERMQGLYDLAHGLVFALMLATVFRSRAEWGILLGVNLTVGVWVSLLGLGAYFELFETGMGVNEGRISSTLGNATYMGPYTMINFITGLGILALIYPRLSSIFQLPRARRAAVSGTPPRTGRRRQRAERREMSQSKLLGYLLYALVACIIVAALVNIWALWMTGTRAAVIGLAAGALVFAVGYIFAGSIRVIRWLSYLILAMMVAGLLLVVLARTTAISDYSTMLERMSQIGLDDASVSGRAEAARAGLRAFVDKPILGWGPENYLIAWGRYFDKHATGVKGRFDHAHNKPVEELVTKGILGLSAYIALWLAMAVVFARSLRRETGTTQLFVWAVAATGVAYFVQNLFLFDTPALSIHFMILVGFAASEEMRAGTPRSLFAKALQSTRAPKWMRNIPSYASSWGNSLVASALVAVVAVVAVILMLNTNIRMYNASIAAKDAVVAETPQVDDFLDGIMKFPGLANSIRELMLTEMQGHLDSISDEEFLYAVNTVSEMEREALEAEPESWLLEAYWAQFYQRAAIRSPTLASDARQHLDRAIELAPRTVEVKGVIEGQIVLEEALED